MKYVIAPVGPGGLRYYIIAGGYTDIAGRKKAIRFESEDDAYRFAEDNKYRWGRVLIVIEKVKE